MAQQRPVGRDIGERIGGQIDAGAQNVARRRGADQREHDKGARPRPIARQGLAEIGVVALEAVARGDIDQTAQPGGRVDEEAAEGLAGPGQLALQDVIGKNGRRFGIGQDIAHALAHPARHVIHIDPGHRQRDATVEALVEGEDGAVGLFEGVGQRAGRRRGTAGKNQRQRNRKARRRAKCARDPHKQLCPACHAQTFPASSRQGRTPERARHMRWINGCAAISPPRRNDRHRWP